MKESASEHEIDAAMADALRRDDTGAYSRAARARRGFRSLVLCALDYAALGVTSLEEVLRVAGEVEEIPGGASGAGRAAGAPQAG